MKVEVNKIVWLVVFSVVVLYIAPWPGMSINKIYDDIIPLVFMLIWFKWMISSCRRNKMFDICMLLIAICILGVISNYLADINTDLKDILLDMYSFLKIFFVYLGTWSLLIYRKRETSYIIFILGSLAKIFIVIGFVFGILNMLGICSMSEQVRFGVNTFSFIYGNASQYGILVGVALAFVIFQNKRYSLKYEIMASIIMLFTLKGMSLIIITVYWMLVILNKKKIKLWQILLVFMGLMLVLRYQIFTYLLDADAPRAILLRYGVITANDLFPIGAGFATYGSAVAAKHYSPLYVLYGFTRRRSLLYVPGEATALYDCYLGMAFGQFGWIGTILLLTVFVIIGSSILRIETDHQKGKYICIALYACVCGMIVMAGSVKGAVGQLMLLSIILFSVYSLQEGKAHDERKIYQGSPYDKTWCRWDIYTYSEHKQIDRSR